MKGTPSRVTAPATTASGYESKYTLYTAKGKGFDKRNITAQIAGGYALGEIAARSTGEFFLKAQIVVPKKSSAGIESLDLTLASAGAPAAADVVRAVVEVK